MEQWSNYSKIHIDIESIEQIVYGCQECEVRIIDSNKRTGRIVFDHVYDLRCSIEDGFLLRFDSIPVDILRNNSIHVVNNSEYIAYFDRQAVGVVPVSEMGFRHYVIFDALDTGIEILATCEPTLIWSD
jgi:hypothetical protein